MRASLLSGLSCLVLCACNAPAASVSEPPKPTKPVLVQGKVPVAPFVAETAQGKPDEVLVYVGASWCEPCRYFHDALLEGRLDTLLAGMRVIEYDLDRDKEALLEAGYTSRMIPLFALPNADGRASARAISGSIKGEKAVSDNLVPRLRELLGNARAR